MWNLSGTRKMKKKFVSMPSHPKKSSNVFSIVTYGSANLGQQIVDISLGERMEDVRCLSSTKVWAKTRCDP